MLESVIYMGFLLILTRKVDLKAGSSKQGKAFLAASGSNWVAARTLWIRGNMNMIMLKTKFRLIQ